MYSKNIPIHVLINIVLFGLSIYMFKIIIDDNLIESEENERRYKLDYSLEDNVIKTIKIQ